tara:strand:- start:220 stop:471 length:252 start_codon:yes stop_codon:yes gene_type:complete
MFGGNTSAEFGHIKEHGLIDSFIGFSARWSEDVDVHVAVPEMAEHQSRSTSIYLRNHLRDPVYEFSEPRCTNRDVELVRSALG